MHTTPRFSTVEVTRRRLLFFVFFLVLTFSLRGAVARIECSNNTDCDDNIQCTEDSCNPTTGMCEHIPDDGRCYGDPNGAICRPSVGGCTECRVDSDCEDNIMCTDKSCDSATGKCKFTPVHHRCSGFCVEFQGCVDCRNNADCDDNVFCTEDYCDTGRGVCVNRPNHGLCSGNPNGRVCEPSHGGCIECIKNSDCDDNNPLTTDMCGANTKCVHIRNSYCEDGVDCTVDSMDSDGSCVHTPDDSLCQNHPGRPFCDRYLGCASCTEDSHCDDHDPCTVDKCDMDTGSCSHTAITTSWTDLEREIINVSADFYPAERVVLVCATEMSVSNAMRLFLSNAVEVRCAKPNGCILNGNPFRDFGGPVLVLEQGSLTLEGFTVSSFFTEPSSVISLYPGSALELKKSVFTGNIGGTSGGVISADNALLRISECLFENNRATNFGGAIHASQSQVSISSSTFRGNHALEHGGAIATFGAQGRLFISESRFLSNLAWSTGGGIYLDCARPEFETNNVFEVNEAARCQVIHHVCDGAEVLCCDGIDCP